MGWCCRPAEKSVLLAQNCGPSSAKKVSKKIDPAWMGFHLSPFAHLYRMRRKNIPCSYCLKALIRDCTSTSSPPVIAHPHPDIQSYSKEQAVEPLIAKPRNYRAGLGSCIHPTKEQEIHGGESARNEEGSSVPTDVISYLSSSNFASLQDSVSKATLQSIAEMGFVKMTEIQAKCIPPLLEVIHFALFH
ncbi:unnamed protein product [Gongylonema pulchrum]|uniref:RNA helicase n=1 Tax=Gongylonema pulchrum TaxID=637853 RepID=A0A183DJ37_9BILA|nr:unnamed protein product [Gongylonema pulchrum]